LKVRRQIAGWRRQLRQRRIPQIVLIFGFWLLGQAMADRCRLPVPGGILGMLLVLALLASGWMRAGSLRRGANFYLGEMLLFFIPAVAAVREHPEFLGIMGLKLLAAIVAGTLVVMVATALSMELCFRLVFASSPGATASGAAAADYGSGLDSTSEGISPRAMGSDDDARH
jgi:holin-like protein